VLIRLYEDSRSPGTCRACAAALLWFDTIAGKRMPMDASAVARKTELDADSRRLIGYYAASESHMGTCPEAARFRS
jgi:hypothetical protein